MQTRIVLLVALCALLIGVAIAPDLLLQIMVRGGFVIGGIAITLALRPRDEETAPSVGAVPVARVVQTS